MDVLVVGAGPGGLAAACVCAEQGARVTVIDRKPEPGAVPWSATLRPDESLGLPAVPSIRRERGPIFVDGRARFRSGPEGQGAHADGAVLLERLAERAGELGVRVRWGTDATELPDEVLDRRDLVVAADSARSTLRARHADRFAPRIRWSTFRTATFSTSRRFPGVTPIVRLARRHLPLVGWAIPQRSGSLIVVEVAEAVYQAELARRPLDAVSRRLEGVLSDELDGAGLAVVSERWSHAPTLYSRRRIHGNTALLGDAALTGYDPLGRGARWAMEDAVVLGRALRDLRRPWSTLKAYQALRDQPDRHLHSLRALEFSERLVDAATRGDRAVVESLVDARWGADAALRASVNAA